MFSLEHIQLLLCYCQSLLSLLYFCDKLLVFKSKNFISFRQQVDFILQGRQIFGIMDSITGQITLHLYVYNCQNKKIQQISPKINRQMLNKNKDQPNQAIADLMLLLGKYQNQLQAHREHLTLRSDFNPECLYRYLAMSEQELTRNHIMYFMEENRQPLKEEESRMLFTVYGYKDKLTYTDFLNYIYPFDVEAIKTISTVHCKKYIKNDDQQPTQEVLCIFLLLIMKEVEFLHKFEEFKMEKLPGSSRQSIKRWVKLFKKTIPPSLGGLSSEYVLTFPELKTILKNLRNLPERKSQPICRRLSLQKQSFIGIDQLEIWLKPWFKSKQQQIIPIQVSQTLFEDLSDSLIAQKST